MIFSDANIAEPATPEGARATSDAEINPPVTMRELQKRLEWERFKDAAHPRRADRRS